MQSSFVRKYYLYIFNTNIDVLKINYSKQKIFSIIITFFLVNNIDKKSQFFAQTFILTDINMDIAFGMTFLTLNNVKVNFTNQEL